MEKRASPAGKRRHPEELEEEKKGKKEEKKGRGRPPGRTSALSREELKSAKRKAKAKKRKESQAYISAHAKAIQEAKRVAQDAPEQEEQGEKVYSQVFTVDGFPFAFAFKWARYYGKEEEVEAIVKAAKKARETRHLAAPKAVVLLSKVRPKTCVEIYTQYKETLADLLQRRPLSRATVRNCVHGILDGLASLHAINYIHGDLKPENIAITADQSIKLIDYGNSIRVKEELAGSSGNKYYDSDFLATPKVHELFSVGCIFMEMLLPDWEMCREKATKESKLSEGLEKMKLLGDAEAWDLARLLTQRTDKHLTATKLLQHTFFGGPGITYQLPAIRREQENPPRPPSSAM